MNPEKRAAGHRGPSRVRPVAYAGWALVMVGYRIAPETTTRLVATYALKVQERRLDREQRERDRPRWF